MIQETQKPQLNIPVVSGSALIAEFDGWEKTRIDTNTTTNFKTIYVDGIKKGNKILRNHEIEIFLNYKSNWSLLMPIVKKIQQLPIDDFTKKKPVMSALMDVEIESLFNSVVVFLRWWYQANR